MLGNHSLLLSLTGSLGLRTLGIHLLLQDSLTRLLGLGLVDLSTLSAMIPSTLINPTYMLNQCSLVLEGVTLAQMVELVVQVLVDLTAGTILDEKTAENTETAHPDDLAVETHQNVSLSSPLQQCIPRHTSIRSTLPLTEATVSADSSCGCEFPGARSRVHGDGLSDDEAICNELADGLAGVGIGDLAGLIGIEPDLALSAADNGSREALLGGEVDPIVRIECQLLLIEDL